MFQRTAVVGLVCLSLVLVGCVDKRQMDTLNSQLSEQSTQLLALKSENVILKSDFEAIEAQADRMASENLALAKQLKLIESEKTELSNRVEALENELEIKNEAALLEIQALNDYYAKILSLKKTASLKSLIQAYKGPLKGSSAEHFGSCLYEAAKREGSGAFIALIEDGDFDFVDGIVGYFSLALVKTSDINYKTQLMVEASALNGTQSPTTLYFYARVLYFLNKA